MTAQSKTTVKSYFETGDRPTQAQFADLVDSYQDYGASGVPYLSYVALINQSTISPITSGPLVVGVRYTITNYVAGDDFINVGAASNTIREDFVATGTTPTNWTHSSQLTSSNLSALVVYNDTGLTIEWARKNIGYLAGNAGVSLDRSKMLMFSQPNGAAYNGIAKLVSCEVVEDGLDTIWGNRFYVVVWDELGNSIDDFGTSFPVEIRIYP